MGTNSRDSDLTLMKKKCSKCGDEVLIDGFHKDAKAKDGHAYLCKSCAKAKTRAWVVSNPDKKRAQDAAYYAANLEKSWAQSTAWQKAHPEAVAIRNAKWSAANPAKVTVKKARHRAKKFRATPEWANHFFIGEAYALAKLRTKVTGIKWEVDHIIPLNSKTVCGFHVENNLQVIPKKQNQTKRNKYCPDSPHIRQSPWPQCFK